VRPVTTEQEAAQAVLAEIALQFVAIEDRLTRIAESLPVPPNQEDMLEHRIPNDLATQLLGLIECVVADDLQPAIEGLEKGARETEEDLVRSYEQRWRWWKP
jgi:hypothetical protein